MTAVRDVQYMRAYSPDELAELGGQLCQALEKAPSIVGIASLVLVLQQFLDRPEVPSAPTPRKIRNLRAALDEASPLLLGACLRGINRHEVVS